MLLSMLFHYLLGTIYTRQHVLRLVAISQDVHITNNHEETSLRYSCSHIGIHYTTLEIITKLRTCFARSRAILHEKSSLRSEGSMDTSDDQSYREINKIQ